MSSKPKIFLSSPHLGTQEFEFVREAFATNWIAPLGPHVDAFEKEFGQILQEGGNRVDGDWPQRGAKGARIGGRRTDDGGRRAEGGRRRAAEGGGPVPNPRAGKPVPRGMGGPAHVGAEDGWREGAPAHSFHLITDSE